MSFNKVVNIFKLSIIYIYSYMLLISWILYITYLSCYELNISITSVHFFLSDFSVFFSFNIFNNFKLIITIFNLLNILYEDSQIFIFHILNYAYKFTFYCSKFNSYFYLIYLMNYNLNFSLIIQYFSILIIFILILSLSIWTRAAGPRVRADQLITITTKTFFLSLILISIIVMILIKIQINK